MKVCGIPEHAAKRAIHMYNNPTEASENKPIGRPKRALDPEYSSAVEEIMLYNCGLCLISNSKGQRN